MRFISIALALSLSLMFSLSLKAQENEMFKNPGCMCCDKWAEHMIDNGFNIKNHSESRRGKAQRCFGHST